MEINRGSRLLNRFKVIGSLGGGTSGTSFLAKDAKLGDKLVVLKALPQNVSIGTRQILKEKVTHAAKINCECLASVIAFIDSPELIAICYEYVEGYSLKDLQANSNITDADLAAILYQECLALETLHSLGIFGLDLSPSHVLLTNEGQVKITGWLTPELNSQVSAEAAQDIWSLGFQVMQLREDLAIQNNADTLLNKVLYKCLQADTTKSYQDLAELKNGLAKVVERLHAWGPIKANTFNAAMAVYLMGLIGFFYALA